MGFRMRDLDDAVTAGVLDGAQARRLQEWLENRYRDQVSFRPVHILYYFGGLIAIGAVSMFVTLAWEDWAGFPMLLLALGFAAIGIGIVFAGWYWQRHEVRIHGTLLGLLPAPVRRLVERAHSG